MLQLNPGHITEAGREHPLGLALAEMFEFERRASGLIAGSASFSDYLEKALLEHITKKASLTAPDFYLALCTAVPEDSKTGTTIIEANYTTYARLKVEGATWTSSGTSPTAIKNNAELTLAACTAGNSTVIGWAGCDALTVGNMLCWGTATSTVISTTQTPPKVAINALEITLD
jgi:hypothetical protein